MTIKEKYLTDQLYKDCHTVLKYLNDASDKSSELQIFKTKELASKTKITFDKICKVVVLLDKNKHIQTGTNIVDDFCYVTYNTIEGRNAFHSRYYLDAGYEQWKNNALHWTQKIGILTATLITIYTFIDSVCLTRRRLVAVELVTKRVTAIEKQLSVLKNLPKHPDTSRNPLRQAPRTHRRPPKN